MKIVIIGSVAAGTSAACKARRNDINSEIIIYEKDKDISYSSCGLPYFIGEDYITRDNIVPRNCMWFKERFDIDIRTEHEVIAIHPETKELTVKNLMTNETFKDTYDKLVLSTGARSLKLPIEGLNNPNVFYLRNVESADSIKSFIKQSNPKKALVIGGGFIGLELLENLFLLQIETTIIEMNNQIMSGIDNDVTVYLEEYLRKKNINLLLGEKVIEVKNNGRLVTTSSGKEIETDCIIVAAGIKPNTELAKNCGIQIGKYGAICVNHTMETNSADIYAIGDCAESYSLITNKSIYVPLGSTANKMGRIAGDIITGIDNSFKGILGTGIVKVFDYAIGKTGLTEKDAIENGYEIEVVHNLKENQSVYLKESREMVIKAVADRKTGKLLGVQIVGEKGVDKRIDVFATAITFGAKVSDLFHLDLCYAPPFSTTKDPVMYTGMILDNAINRNRKIMTVQKLVTNRNNYKVIDVRSEKDFNAGHIENAINIPFKKLKGKITEFDTTENIVVHCNKGVTGNAAQNLLINCGFKHVYNLSGGYKNFKMTSKLFQKKNT
ncbi:MAG: dehydrogenase [Spirochaetes bacterium GWF1_31_7]|nr:MAG: dehydrogenase [Spirochaetes bacterium GWE1_32_154]OHD47841.1 MAG: dehydrogenase [Spirochaetes bacterium GWF1_31_7]OHD52203.1 MAG: dehydrogenase [Spirochaetes bacterium GWE2_31_10]HBD93173.1 dehydrogenase [Spirochaetia bacterium]HBI36362.1 dehydrogenase [Spirochaetia bacterium]